MFPNRLAMPHFLRTQLSLSHHEEKRPTGSGVEAPADDLQLEELLQFVKPEFDYRGLSCAILLTPPFGHQPHSRH